MAIKIICDRCGKTIDGTTYYMIDIHAEDINNQYGVSSFDTIATNINTTFQHVFAGRPCYCKRCIDSIRDFINEDRTKERSNEYALPDRF